MRFLMGIIIGTGLTLILASSLQPPEQAKLERARAVVSELWDTLIERTSDSLFQVSAESQSQDTDDLIEALQQEKLADLNARNLSMAQGGYAGAAAAEQPAQAPPAPDEVAPPPLAAPATVSTPVERPHLSRPDEPPATETGSGQTVHGHRLAATASNASGVWVPFHSRMSAEGFAARLSRELRHDFRVERRGAGSYEVVFDAASDSERRTILAEIEAITGR